jgi:DNA helicase-2/ATP-dependent DNA helicase PcrA
VRDTFGDELRLKGQRVAVITYTNAASEEIQRRLDFDPTIDVSTIHSFAWSLIEGLNRDIREWLRAKITTDITKLEAEEAKGRKGTEASRTRLKKSPREPNAFKTSITSNVLFTAQPEKISAAIR